MPQYVLLELMGGKISWYENHERYFLSELGNELNKTGLNHNILRVVEAEDFDALDWSGTCLAEWVTQKKIGEI